jgi:hypothetical protein
MPEQEPPQSLLKNPIAKKLTGVKPRVRVSAQIN